MIRSEAAAKEVGQWFDTTVSDSDKLALTGAQWEAFGLMPEPGPTDEHRAASTKIDPELVALLIAGMMRCLVTSCEHVRTQLGIVRHVFLAPRICRCEQCIGSFQQHFVEHDTKQEHAGECDLCLAQGVTVFHKVRLVYNGAVYYGDFCPSCKVLAIGK